MSYQGFGRYRQPNKQARSGGTGLCTLLTVAFIVLKLCKVIDWSWWWVLAPAWGPLAIIAAILVVAIILSFVAGALRALTKVMNERRK